MSKPTFSLPVQPPVDPLGQKVLDLFTEATEAGDATLAGALKDILIDRGWVWNPDLDTYIPKEVSRG